MKQTNKQNIIYKNEYFRLQLSPIFLVSGALYEALYKASFLSVVNN